ncbi:MAG: YggS family pyridoxal phosphate-dependent enzyme [Desulfocapsaceae bacterium]|nr:YggS family pyridoxal phosphate-dependent enzyme [Desulfocapsaceae bacterium]
MIANNLQRIRQNIEAIARRSNRRPDTIRLIAVSKTFPATDIREALAFGQTLFGENYIQEAERKYLELGQNIRLHFIGHLQSNKAHIAVKIFEMIETVDQIKLAASLNRYLEQSGKIMDILVQVNIGRDEKKSGVAPEDTEDFLKKVMTLSNLRVRGLMTMPPFSEDPEKSRIHFSNLRQLAERLQQKNLFYDNTFVELSMGMSHDYPIAIEEGATLVRVGSAIFGDRS